jgi:hypothetical protein
MQVSLSLRPFQRGFIQPGHLSLTQSASTAMVEGESRLEIPIKPDVSTRSSDHGLAAETGAGT